MSIEFRTESDGNRRAVLVCAVCHERIDFIQPGIAVYDDHDARTVRFYHKRICDTGGPAIWQDVETFLEELAFNTIDARRP